MILFTQNQKNIKPLSELRLRNTGSTTAELCGLNKNKNHLMFGLLFGNAASNILFFQINPDKPKIIKNWYASHLVVW